MNVIYDISLLGMAVHSACYRTGIYRTVEEVFSQLLKQNNLNLDFTVSKSEFIEYQTLDYLFGELNAHPKKGKFCPSFVGQNNFRNLLRNKLKYYRNLYRQEKSCRTLFKREFLRICYQLLPEFKEQFNPKIFASVDIFHSPFFPIREELLNLYHLKKFFTVYDLILVKHPEFFRDNEQSELVEYFHKMDSEHYVICISESTKQDFLEINKSVDPQKVFVTHLAAADTFHLDKDPNKFAMVKKKYHLPATDYFLSLSTLEPRKNIPTVIRSFVDLVRAEKFDDVNLVLVGKKGWSFDKIFDEIDGAKDLRDRIIVTGFVAEEDLSVIYSNALGFFYMSFYEGFGLPPLEAMQCGVPVVTSNTSSLPEVVGESGITLHPKDEDGVKQAMLDLYQRGDLRDGLIQKSLARAKRFSWQKCVDQTVAAYRMALDA